MNVFHNVSNAVSCHFSQLQSSHHDLKRQYLLEYLLMNIFHNVSNAVSCHFSQLQTSHHDLNVNICLNYLVVTESFKRIE